jgi:aminoglycoside N3'-acetyltransferase
MQGHQRFKELLNRLNITRGDVVYLHTSFKRISYLGLTGEQFINILVERLGERGTLVLPSFAWNLDKSQRPWKGYNDYFHSRPVFDVRGTPTNIGWIPELFRVMQGIHRSVNYWWPICAKGALAKELTTGQEKVVHPYGIGSSFDLLRTYGAKILGLGVSLNTTSLAPVADYALGDRHPHKVFTDAPQKGVVVTEDGTLTDTYSFWLLPEVVRLIKPSVVIEESQLLRDSVRRADEGSNINFSYPYNIYHAEALRLGEQARADGQPVPWLRNYPLSK